MHAHRFRFDVVAGGVNFDNEWLDQARHVESLGFDILVIPDGLGYTPSPEGFRGIFAGRCVEGSIRSWNRTRFPFSKDQLTRCAREVSGCGSGSASVISRSVTN
ncbi:MAG: hypothetical protein WBW04_00555 [Nitrolancea sp.]